jgi:glucose/arabinose dehydrogenase
LCDPAAGKIGLSVPEPYRGGTFSGLRGSWNRGNLEGYRVIFVAFQYGKPQGGPIDVLSGFLVDGGDRAHGRPWA